MKLDAGIVMKRNRHHLSQKLHDLLDEAGELHDRKQNDYGLPDDPFANVRASEDFNVPGWVGCMVRANDKMKRVQKAAKGEQLANESLRDSLMDLAIYSLIAIVLYEDEYDDGWTGDEEVFNTDLFIIENQDGEGVILDSDG